MVWVIVALVILGLIGAVIYLAVQNAEKQEALEEQEEEDLVREEQEREIEESASHDLSRVKRGDVVIFEGATENYDDINITVDRINRYETHSGYTWHEYSGMSDGARQHVEYHEDDTPFISLDTDTVIDFNDLGINEAFLEECDESRSSELCIEAEGRTWRFKECGETFYYKNGKGGGEGYYSFEFEAEDDETLTLYIEKWEDETEVGISRNLIPQSIKHYPV